MPIEVQPDRKLFHLRAGSTSYILQVLPTGHLAHVYWGKGLRDAFEAQEVFSTELFARPFEPLLPGEPLHLSLDVLPQEYPAFGHTDFREPAYQVQLRDGSTAGDLRYRSYSVQRGKPPLPGLPHLYVESDDDAETLEIVLEDTHAGLRVQLTYTAYAGLNIIVRSARLTNIGAEPVRILRALSATVDFVDGRLRMLQLSGAWARERHPIMRQIEPGVTAIGSTRGASGHYHNPFFVLLRPGADEYHGEAYGFSLVYSGNFLGFAEMNHYGFVRAGMGINPFDFSWILNPGESFQTPELVLVYSDQGLTGLSHTYHDAFRRFLLRGAFKDRPRPVLINTWEATHFHFTAADLLEIARIAKDLGIELFVLDDGWFGKRNDDTSSLGDWVPNEQKLPGGLRALGEAIVRLGLQFGIWVEPEMVSPDSDLYRAHPDWCLHIPGRPRSLSRHQLVLDLAREDVCEYVLEQMRRVINSGPISYVKWDMNRHMTEVGSKALPPDRQRETAHRYMLGLYRILGQLTEEFPHVLFESCSGGGGRFDPGMLYYMPQTWTSDNTDAVERLRIQWGTSIAYPLITMGAHVSAVPNQQVGRISPLATRGDVALFGSFGYELDPRRLSAEEKEVIKAQVNQYKRLRPLILSGDFYRLQSPFENNTAAWMVVSKDRREALVGAFRVLAIPNPGPDVVRLRGLDPSLDYVIEQTGERLGGDRLMNVGIDLSRYGMPPQGDFRSVVLHIRAVGQPAER